MRAVLSTLMGVALVGCMTYTPGDNVPRLGHADRMTANKMLMDDVFQPSEDDLILEEHTLYAHHFQTGSARITPLGEKHLLTLATHFRERGGELNILRGDVSDALYSERLKTVRNLLEESQVDVRRVRFVESEIPGDGNYSQELLRDLATLENR